MSLIDHILQQPAKIIETVTDVHGDQVKVSEVSTLCRFRWITEVGANAFGESADAFDAIIWFFPSTTITEGTIVFVDDVYWRVNRLIKARRLKGMTVVFQKAFVKRHELVES